jgi:hypothetical protein
MFLKIFSTGRNNVTLFENGERKFAFYRDQMSGNPVKTGDGCATVTGYKLPDATASRHACMLRRGKAGVRFRPGVRIPV